MLIRKKPDIRPSEITPESVYLNRRSLLQAAGIAGAALSLPAMAEDIPARYRRLPNIAKSPLSTDEPLTSFEDVSSYNNFYEFGTGKSDPVAYSGDFKPQPWSVTIDGWPNLPNSPDSNALRLGSSDPLYWPA